MNRSSIGIGEFLTDASISDLHDECPTSQQDQTIIEACRLEGVACSTDF
jgi:hypothetical protein